MGGFPDDSDRRKPYREADFKRKRGTPHGRLQPPIKHHTNPAPKNPTAVAKMYFGGGDESSRLCLFEEAMYEFLGGARKAPASLSASSSVVQEAIADMEDNFEKRCGCRFKRSSTHQKIPRLGTEEMVDYWRGEAYADAGACQFSESMSDLYKLVKLAPDRLVRGQGSTADEIQAFKERYRRCGCQFKNNPWDDPQQLEKMLR